MQTPTVGRFTYDPTTGSISGPRAYVESDAFAKILERIRRGDDPCGAFRFSPDPVTAVLVTLQTDFAEWRGMRDFEAQMGGAR